jgi:hypothetical protein
LDEEDNFTYQYSIVNKQGATKVRSRIGKARTAFHQLKNIWGSTNLTLITKIMMLKTQGLADYI